MRICFLRDIVTSNSFVHNKTQKLFKNQKWCRCFRMRILYSRFPWKNSEYYSTYDPVWLIGSVGPFKEHSKRDRKVHISRRSFCNILWSSILFYSFSNRLVGASESQVYDYDSKSSLGPPQWGSLEESYYLCSEGKLQSPIVLTKSSSTVENVSESPYRLLSRRAKFFARQEPSLRNIIVIEQSFPPPSMVGDVPLMDQSGIPAPAATIEDTISKDTYTFDHIVFHIPSSEHALEGIRTDAEMNIVFRKSSRDHSDYIYLSALLRIGNLNPSFNPIIQLYSSFSNDDSSKKPKVDFDLGDIIPPLSSSSYFSYQGSLSFPPCSENVHWLVFAELLTIGQEQWNMIRCCQEMDNVRPLQASNDRNVVLYSYSSENIIQSNQATS
ncbi:carbonic anhydrase isoform 1 [Galdieria sulphuraria]|uniref:carbonic anhydrase n=1 Tax=Galdieria sulphuraria TaxID=130081 RepID=M2Y6Q2_GALSU|nr:carbonic anhydrase isoform 1 [Galdieria sulphuraria]EME31534.1 carbonic anhydrase isoform 1 [Galdieria sulphuraria]|eukprot:XP_005708054.1 carbonic anhydrase isoform 1 [Galdieria sulphuraria]